MLALISTLEGGGELLRIRIDESDIILRSVASCVSTQRVVKTKNKDKQRRAKQLSVKANEFGSDSAERVA
jgi:hypothetical protein